jgi:YVTN family beta-propeller protein
VYVANNGSNTVSVIGTATNQVVGSPIPVGNGPIGVAVTPDGSRVYVANNGSNTVSVIDTTKIPPAVVATVGVGVLPVAFGKFIASTPVFWGVHSLTAANTMIGKQTLFEVVSQQAGQAPAFWGRYIGRIGRGNLRPNDPQSLAEITFLHGHNCRIALFFRDTATENADIFTYQDGVDYATTAIGLASALGVPRGVWIYADIEIDPDFPIPTADFFRGWSDTMFKSIYGGGIYGNTASNDFNQPYCIAYTSDSNMQTGPALLWTNQPSGHTCVRSTTFNPTIPSCHPPTVIQHYSLNCPIGGRLVDMDMANGQGFASMWA